MDSRSAHETGVVVLNVGGTRFGTRRSTMLRSDSFFSGLVAAADEPTVEFFIDRDGTHFRHILNWMRGVRFLPEDESTLIELLCEAEYYCLVSLVHAITTKGKTPSVAKTLRCICMEMRQA